MTTINTRSRRDVARRVLASDAIYGEIVNFLIDEVALLDEDRQLDWLELLADDIHYHMPRRQVVYRRDGSGFDPWLAYFEDDRLSLGLRVRRNVEIQQAYDRDPAPRTRRFVTNIAVHGTDTDEEYLVESSILLTWVRFRDVGVQMISGKRVDTVRRVAGELRLADRLILLDQTDIGIVFINVFL